MESVLLSSKISGIPEFLSGGGELGRLIREYDWEATPLGPVNTWPQSLRTCIRIMLASRQPIWIGWGPDLIKFYNDPYRAIVGGKHPWALGKPASVVWKDIWTDIEPLLKTVMEKDEGTYVESQLLIMERNGYPEETYYTFSYTPIPGDDGSTAGMICANSDDTDRIISERQLKTLTQLGKQLTDTRSYAEVIDRTINTLNDNLFDFPFTLFYRLQDASGILSGCGDLGKCALELPCELDFKAPGQFSKALEQATLTKRFQILENVSAILGKVPAGAWKETSDKALILPVFQAGNKAPYGFLLVGCNPYRLIDEKYTDFFTLIADQVAISLANVFSLEEERKRAEALAAIDRAKTIFFSNISHEFRTPLTLLLGPIEETLQEPERIEETKARMEVAYRNALRLQRMVNTLLEFSRIEAGRVEGKFNLVDIGKFTVDLASTFRSAIEKAGMQLHIFSDKINAEVYVDMDMWERVILNLVSNAFKYSKKGSITLEIKQAGTDVQVSVADTGIGIPEQELEKVFDRFHRVENMEGRSKEGTGIGLAMVKELVKLHSGSIRVTSKVGVGSVFVVTLPTGKEHIPAGKIIAAAADTFPSVHSRSFLEEASKWGSSDKEQYDLADSEANDKGTAYAASHTKEKYSVLLADDNADMREYVERLLSRQFKVIVAKDGNEAFDKALNLRPDLILSDIMMPVLDGFGLIKKVRRHPDTKNIPVIFLSARAGEEAKVEGLDAGVDDYLVKPFSSRELIARVEANIKIAKNRIAAEHNLKSVIMQSPVAMTILRGENLVIEMANEKALELWGKKNDEVINRSTLTAFPELVEQGFDEILKNIYNTGKPFIANEMPLTLMRNGQPEVLYINFIYEPLHNADNSIGGIIGIGLDVSEQVRARKVIQKSEERARLAIESADLGTYEINLVTNEMKTSGRFNQIWGVDNNLSRKEFSSLIHPDDVSIRQKAHQQSVLNGNLHYEARVIWKDRSVHWVRVKGKVLYDDADTPATLLGVIQDITDQKLFAQHLTDQVIERTIELQRSNEDLQQFAHVASHDLKEPVRKIKTFSGRLQDEYGDCLPDQGKVFLEKVQHSADRMFAMIDGVLNYSKINSTDEVIETIDLNLIFTQIETDLEIFIQQKKAVISVQAALPLIQGASVLIYQLFYNLVNNSLKFSKAGEQPRITIMSSVTSESGVEFAKVLVEDNGIGFSQEHAEKIFQTFTRLNSKDKFEGTGLGLALCKKIVERHHGRITAKGEKDKGAAFTVLLPLKSDQTII